MKSKRELTPEEGAYIRSAIIVGGVLILGLMHDGVLASTGIKAARIAVFMVVLLVAWFIGFSGKKDS
jgi:hypothetical protein